MAFWINITYTAGTFGATVSTLDIFSNYDSYTTAVATGVAKATLVSGYALSVPDGTTSVRVRGTGVCASIYQDITVGGAPTAPTPTPAAPTPTPAAPTPTPAAPTPTPAAPTPTPAAPTPTPAAPTPTPEFFYTAEYCSGSPGGSYVARFTVDQVANSTFEVSPGVCIFLTGVATGPTSDFDLGDGSSYVGSNCSACPAPPTAPPPPVVYEYWDYEPCTGPNAYTGAQYTLQAIAGSSPGCISQYGEVWSVVGLGAYSGPNNHPLFSGAFVSCGSCE
jgi:hypothetical protein